MNFVPQILQLTASKQTGWRPVVVARLQIDTHKRQAFNLIHEL